MHISNITPGKNSVLFDSDSSSILYEKLANTIHSGSRDQLTNLQGELESFYYHPIFESETLHRKRNEKLAGLVLNITEKCNFKCDYCINSKNYENFSTKPEQEMDLEIAKKGIDLFIPNSENPALISFYGGEPSLKMLLIKEITDYAHKRYPDKQIRFSMTSNFYDIEKYFDFIISEGMYIVVSLDGPKDIHDAHRIHKSGKPTWEVVIKNLKKLNNLSPGYVNTHIGESVTCAESEKFLEIADFFIKERDYSVFRVGGLEAKGLKHPQKNNLSSSQINILADKFIDYVTEDKPLPNLLRLIFEEKLKFITTRSREQLPEILPLSGCCYPGNRKIFVDTGGELYICEKFGKRLPIGNVEKGIDYRKTELAINHFLEIRNSLCTQDCWAQRLCSPCIHSAKDIFGDISLEGLSQTCEFSKSEILTSLMMYTNLLSNKKEFIKNYLVPQLNKSEVKNE